MICEKNERTRHRPGIPSPLSGTSSRILAGHYQGAQALEMGAVMKVVMPRVVGQADGKAVQKVVQSLLEGGAS
jgi:hypothetical protein